MNPAQRSPKSWHRSQLLGDDLLHSTVGVPNVIAQFQNLMDDLKNLAVEVANVKVGV
jgi:hypothetical protein